MIRPLFTSRQITDCTPTETLHPRSLVVKDFLRRNFARTIVMDHHLDTRKRLQGQDMPGQLLTGTSKGTSVRKASE